MNIDAKVLNKNLNTSNLKIYNKDNLSGPNGTSWEWKVVLILAILTD